MLLAVARGSSKCTNECSLASNGICDPSCPCGTDCDDCGIQWCTSDCGTGYNTCVGDYVTWCCDQSSATPDCALDKPGYCQGYVIVGTTTTSTKKKSSATWVWALFVPFAFIGCVLRMIRMRRRRQVIYSHTVLTTNPRGRASARAIARPMVQLRTTPTATATLAPTTPGGEVPLIDPSTVTIAPPVVVDPNKPSSEASEEATVNLV